MRLTYTDKIIIAAHTILFLCVCILAFIAGVDNAGKTEIAMEHRTATLTSMSLAELGNVRVRRA